LEYINPEKRQIQNAFDAGAQTYHQHAEVQASLAQKLAETIATSAFDVRSIWEVGYGTGLFTNQLIQNQIIQNWAGIEISPLSAKLHQERFQNQITSGAWHIGDAEIELPGHSVDCVCGNAVFQWFKEPKTFLERLHPMTKMLAFSSFGPNNLLEFRTSYQQTTGQTFPSPVQYHTVEELESILNETGWMNFDIKSFTIQQNFKNLKDAILHFRDTGVSPKGHLSLTPNLYRNWSRNFQEFGTDEGVSCHWDCQIFICTNY
jgi:ubiquinone/menaquinone biosynthesis C-methylase UbiE